MFKLLFIGYLFGIRSEHQLIREFQVNVAYRWFLGLGLTNKVPDASTLSANRTPSNETQVSRWAYLLHRFHSSKGQCQQEVF